MPLNGKIVKLQSSYEIDCPFIALDNYESKIPTKVSTSVYWYISMNDYVFGITLRESGKIANFECEDTDIDLHTFNSLVHILVMYYNEQIIMYGYIEPTRKHFACQNCTFLTFSERAIAKTYVVISERSALSHHGNVSSNIMDCMTKITKNIIDK